MLAETTGTSSSIRGVNRVRSVQLNFRYFLQDQKKALTEGDAAQYAVAQLRLPQAHQLARGMNVLYGKVTYEAVADAHGLDYAPLEDVLPLSPV